VKASVFSRFSLFSLLLKFLREIVLFRTKSLESSHRENEHALKSKAKSYDKLLMALEARRKARLNFPVSDVDFDIDTGLPDKQTGSEPDRT